MKALEASCPKWVPSLGFESQMTVALAWKTHSLPFSIRLLLAEDRQPDPILPKEGLDKPKTLNPKP